MLARPLALAPSLAILLLTACGGGEGGGSGASGTGGGEATEPTRCEAGPTDPAARRAAIDELGRRAYAAMRAARPQRLLLDDVALRAVVDSETATRFAALRLTIDRRIGDPSDFGSMLERADYAGICLQGARDEPAGGVLGLTSDGWIFERMLLIGQRAGGGRVAAWIEGTFVYTDAGFYALDLERVEEPRWEHSDLEIAPCDLSIRGDLPDSGP